MNSIHINPSQYHSELGLDRSDIFSAQSWLSKSTVYELYGSSLYKWRYFPKQFDAPTASMTWGSLVDVLITAPEDMHEQFAISGFDNYRTKEAREWKAQAIADGKAIITPALIDEAKQAAAVLQCKHRYAASIIEKSKTQVMLLNKVLHPAHPEQLQLKALVDLAPECEPFLVDLKTTVDITPRGIASTMSRFGYAAQAGHYLNLWNSLHPDDQRDRFQFLFQESSPPYEVVPVEIPQTDIAAGSDIFSFLLGKLVKAAVKNWWPMRYERPVLLGRSASGQHADEDEMDGLTEV